MIFCLERFFIVVSFVIGLIAALALNPRRTVSVLVSEWRVQFVRQRQSITVGRTYKSVVKIIVTTIIIIIRIYDRWWNHRRWRWRDRWWRNRLTANPWLQPFDLCFVKPVCGRTASLISFNLDWSFQNITHDKITYDGWIPLSFDHQSLNIKALPQEDDSLFYFELALEIGRSRWS